MTISSLTIILPLIVGATTFDGGLSSWNPKQVKSMKNMFSSAAQFRGNGMENWDTSSLEEMEQMFCKFCFCDSHHSICCLLSVLTEKYIYLNSAVVDGATVFNGDISTWLTSKVTNMQGEEPKLYECK